MSQLPVVPDLMSDDEVKELVSRESSSNTPDLYAETFEEGSDEITMGPPDMAPSGQVTQLASADGPIIKSVHVAGVRRALDHIGGESRLEGDPDLACALARAFDVERDEALARDHIHGFHSYPARLHPVTARRLIEDFCPSAASSPLVLDPFCGSGTVLVEARIAGVRALGRDVNPLALRLAKFKTRATSSRDIETLLAACRWVQAESLERRERGAKVTKQYGEEDVALFAPHVLMELDGIRDAMDRIEPMALRLDVELILSSILTKISKQRGDSGRYLQDRRLPPGFAAKMLVYRAEEVCRQLAEFARRVPQNAPLADVRSDDARTMGTVGEGKVSLMITSPPYAATYDYLDHHDVRLRWLTLSAEGFDRLELGARRDYAPLDVLQARMRWKGELSRVLASTARVLKDDGRAILVLGDSAVARVALRADEIVHELVPQFGLEVLASASQPRPHFHEPSRNAFAQRARQEHLLLVRRESARPAYVGSP